MELPLSDILDLDIFQKSEIVAGYGGINNDVSFVTVMDVPDIVKWLHGGEILLVANLFDSTMNAGFIQALKEKSVSAIITKERYASNLDPEMRALCDRCDLPIIAVPDEIAWSDILNPITQLVVETQYKAIYQAQMLHASLMSFMIGGASLDGLCADIHKNFGLSIALTDSHLIPLSSSPDIDWQKVLDGLSLTSAVYEQCLGANIKGDHIPGYIYSCEYLARTEQRLFIFPVVRSHVNYGFILVPVPTSIKTISASEIMKVDQISQVLALDSIKKQEVNNAVRRYNNLLLDRILSPDNAKIAERAEIERSLNTRLHKQYYIALTTRPEIRDSIYSQLFSDINADGEMFQDVLCFERGNYLVFFIPADTSDIRALVNELHKRCCKYLGSVKIGVSEATENKFLKAYNQAMQVDRYLERYSSNSPVCFYTDLGLLRFFMDRSGELSMDFLMDVKRRYLFPLEQYDAEKNAQLKQTLLAYVLSNYHIAETLDKLYIHKNTLYARLRRIETLLNCSLDSNEDLFNIQLAIKIDQLQLPSAR